MSRAAAQPPRLPEIQELAAEVSRSLADGTLTLGQVVDLTEDEVAAVARAARTQRRKGRPDHAATLYGMLLTFFPYRAELWRALAAVERQMGALPEAVACYEVAALLGERHGPDALAEARCLRKMGAPGLARDLLAEARARARGGSGGGAR